MLHDQFGAKIIKQEGTPWNMFPIWRAFPAFRCGSGWVVTVPVNDGAWWLLRCDSAPVECWSGGPVRKCTAVKGVVLWAGVEVKACSYGCDEWLGPTGACTYWISLVICRGRERGYFFFFLFCLTATYRSLILLLFVRCSCIQKSINQKSIALVLHFPFQVDTQISCTVIGRDFDGTEHRGSTKKRVVVGKQLEVQGTRRGSLMGAGVKALGSNFSLTFTPSQATSGLVALLWESRNLSNPWYFKFCHSARSNEGNSALSWLSGLSTTFICSIHFSRAGFSH